MLQFLSINYYMGSTYQSSVLADQKTNRTAESAKSIVLPRIAIRTPRIHLTFQISEIDIKICNY